MSQPFWMCGQSGVVPSGMRFVDENGIITTPAITSTDACFGLGFSLPWGVAVPPCGANSSMVFVVDEGVELLYGIDPKTLVLTVIAGNCGGSGARGWSFGDIYGVTCDAAGNPYVGDVSNHTVTVVNMQATTQTLYGVSVASGDAANVVDPITGPLFKPYEVGFDSVGNMYIIDLQESCVFKMLPDGTISGTAVVGTAGTPGNSGDGGPPSAALLDSPQGMTYDQTNDLLYIVDVSTNVGGPAVVRVVNFSTNLHSVFGVAISPNTIQKIFTFPMTEAPWSCKLDSTTGNLYITGFAELRGSPTCVLRQLTLDPITGLPTEITVAGQDGNCVDAGDGGPATSASIISCMAIAFAVAGTFCGGTCEQVVGNPLICECGTPTGSPVGEIKQENLSPLPDGTTTNFTVPNAGTVKWILWNGQTRVDFSQSGLNITTFWTPNASDVPLVAFYQS